MSRAPLLAILSLAIAGPRLDAAQSEALPAAIKSLPRHTRSFTFLRQGIGALRSMPVWDIAVSNLPPEARALVEQFADDASGAILLAALETGTHHLDNFVFLVGAQMPRIRNRWLGLRKKYGALLNEYPVELPPDLEGRPAITIAGKQAGFLAASEDWLFFSNVEASAESAARGTLGSNGDFEQNRLFSRLRAEVNLTADLIYFADLTRLSSLTLSYLPPASAMARTDPVSDALRAAGLDGLRGFLMSDDREGLHFALEWRSRRHGLSDTLFQNPTPCSLLRRIPRDYHVVARLAIDSLDDLAHTYRTTFGQIDVDIAVEFDREIAELKATTGIDLRRQIFANLTGSCALAARFLPAEEPQTSPSVRPLLVTGVKDATPLRVALSSLLARLDKPATQEEQDGTIVWSRDMGLPIRAMGLSDRVFVLAPSRDEAWRVLRDNANAPTAGSQLTADLTTKPVSTCLLVRGITDLVQMLGSRPAGFSSSTDPATQEDLVLWIARRDDTVLYGELRVREDILAGLVEAALTSVKASKAEAHVEN